MTVKIGFGYKARRGKDTACRAIVEQYGYLGVKQYAFADELRAEINAAVEIEFHGASRCGPLSYADAMRRVCKWAGVSYDPTTATPEPGYPYGKQRALYQWWGTEYRRMNDPQYWVKRLAARIEQEQPKWAVISDVRFFNEFEFCDYRVRMERPGFEIDDGAHHISERQLDTMPQSRWDDVISATTPEEVQAQARKCFLGIIARRYQV